MAFFFFLPIIVFFFSSSSRHLLEPLSRFFHGHCLKLIPTSQYQNITEALICAEPLKFHSQKEAFINSGLYHLIVVSGSHLALFCLLLEFLLKPLRRFFPDVSIQIFILFVISFYALACRLEPPLVRACFALCLGLLSQKMKWNYHSLITLFISVLLSLSFEPNWISSLSLLLSATASLSLFLTKTEEDLFLKQLKIYFILMPLLLGWGNLHPVTIFTNALLAPIISFFLFPLALLTIPFPFLAGFLDFTLHYSLKVLSWTGQSTLDLQNKNRGFFQIQALWLYFLILVSWQYYSQLQKRRD